jgi:hypothetical protein
MKRTLLSLLLLTGWPAVAFGGEVTVQDFQVKTTADLLDLCTVSPDDPRHEAAIHFCHGFLVGAYAYHQAAAAGPGGHPLVCAPDPPPTRNEAIAEFVAWAQAHPEYQGDQPVETEFRFLVAKWPCKD